jgi:hypothetical protein
VKKIAQNVAQTIFGHKLIQKFFAVNKSSPKTWATSLVFKQVDNFQKAKIAKSGVDVMIKIFCNFCRFSAEKLAFFSKTNVMIKFLHHLALF